MKKLVRFFGIMAIGIVISSSTVSAQGCGHCDGSYEGYLDPGDIICLISYLYVGGPWFDGEIDIDDYEGVTSRDLVFLTDHIGTDFGPIFCPPSNSPFVPIPDSSFLVEYTNMIPAGDSEMRLPIYLTMSNDLNIVQLPMRLRIGEIIPNIDSILTTGSSFNFGRIDTGNGEFAIFMASGGFSVPLFDLEVGKQNRLATVYLSFPPAAIKRTLSIDWTVLSPIQAPTQDSTIFPAVFFTRKDGAGVFTPSKRSFICGDVDGSGGQPDIADLTFLIDHLFINFPPLGNPLTGNVDGSQNGDGSSNVDIADLTFLIDHLFINFPQIGC